jgi:DNA invertase Pin-like site-specific DNA recombinase
MSHNNDAGARINKSMNHSHEPTHGGAQAAIYCRTATGGAIQTQLQACQAFAQQHGYLVPESYVCLDNGYSGVRLDRPGLQRLRVLIRTRAIHAVIVSDLARLSRTVSDQLLLADECDAAEITVHTVVSPPIPTVDSLRVLLHDIEPTGEQGDLQ